MNDKLYCKFCGKEISSAKYISSRPHPCLDCVGYCNKKCKLASKNISWHGKPCINCKHNPYRKNYKFVGGEWVRK